MAKPRQKTESPPKTEEDKKEDEKKPGVKGMKLDSGTWGDDLAEVAAQEGGEAVAQFMFKRIPKGFRSQFRTGGIAGRAVLNLILSRFLPKVPFFNPLRIELVSTIGRLAKEEYERDQRGETGEEAPRVEIGGDAVERPRLDYGRARTNLKEMLWFARTRSELEKADDPDVLDEFDRMFVETLNSRGGSGQKKGNQNGRRDSRSGQQDSGSRGNSRRSARRRP
ncbi:MAG: hypothetical protein WCV82_04420 [Candidatus Paceibacterota bacterium]